jgi:hypothetical protein
MISAAGLMERVEFDTNGGCWLWAKATNEKGYGIWAREGAHRVSYRLFKGPTPAGFHVCHKCDVKGCVNPDHLFLGTPMDNFHDSREKSKRGGGAVWTSSDFKSPPKAREPFAIRPSPNTALARIVEDIRSRGLSMKELLHEWAEEYGDQTIHEWREQEARKP